MDSRTTDYLKYSLVFSVLKVGHFKLSCSALNRPAINLRMRTFLLAAVSSPELPLSDDFIHRSLKAKCHLRDGLLELRS